MTRTEYMNNAPKYSDREASRAHHQAYFAQFVTKLVIDAVKARIGIDKIKDSTDEHFNDINLSLWDSVFSDPLNRGGMNCDNLPDSCKRIMREMGEGNSLSTGVCIAKAAAFIIKNS